MSPYKPFHSRRGIHHFPPVKIIEGMWKFFSRSSGGMKIVIVGIVCAVMGLLFPWVQIGESNISAFSLLCGGVGWIITFFLVLLLIHFFFYEWSRRIEKKFPVFFDSRHIYARFGSLIILITIIITISLTGSASMINSDITMTTGVSGLVLTILGGLFLIIGGAFIRRAEEKQGYKHVFVHGVEEDDRESYKKILGEESDDENMKLPI